jgi:hypothetical protein
MSRALSDSPQVLENGTHVFLVKSIRLYPNNETCDVSHGQIQWNQRDGVTFNFECPRRCPDFQYQVDYTNAGVGSIQKLSEIPDCVAYLFDDTEISLFGMSPTVTSSSDSRLIAGKATYAKIILQKEWDVSFWHDTIKHNRLFLAGLEVSRWPNHVEKRIKHTDGSESIYSPGEMLVSKPFQLFLSTALKGINLENGIWLSFEVCEIADRFWYDKECETVQMLLSLLAGRRISFLWKDNDATDSSLMRTYYGGERRHSAATSIEQPVPLGETVEALSHCEAVVHEIPKLFDHLRSIRSWFNTDWIISPIWYASHAFLDDQLTLATVSLERLADACREIDTKTVRPEAISMPEMLAALRKETVKIGEKLGIDPRCLVEIKKKLPNSLIPGNENRLLRIFEAIGLELTDSECAVIEYRNRCLHGRPTLKNSAAVENTKDEIHRFDTLRTLINRAVLQVLKYHGPYVDYSDRPARGNFPIKFMKN